MPTLLGYSKSSTKREIYSNNNYTKKKRFHANNLRMYLKDLEKQDQANPSISRKKEKSKDQSRNKGNID
jgi:hypothetical protein